jgi:hypothetical protein
MFTLVVELILRNAASVNPITLERLPEKIVAVIFWSVVIDQVVLICLYNLISKLTNKTKCS